MTEDKYVVVEMDMALVCEDTKTRGFGVYMIPGSNFSIAQFQLFNDKIGRVHTGSSGGYSVTAPYTDGALQFAIPLIVN